MEQLVGKKYVKPTDKMKEDNNVSDYKRLKSKMEEKDEKI